MNHLEIAKNLRLINKWRLGNDERLDQPKPADISRWLDAAADALEVAADAAVAQEQNSQQVVVLNRELGEARESVTTYAHLLAVACSDLERKSRQLWHANWEADYIVEAIREFEAVKCELIRQVERVTAERDKYAKRASLFAGERDSIAADGDRLRAHVAERESEIERWRVATAKLRDAAEETGRVANEQIARAEARAAELEAEMERNAWTISPAMAQARIEQLAARVAELERDIADITEVWGHEITDYLKARAEGRARKQGGAQ